VFSLLPFPSYAINLACYIGRLATTRIGWPPNTAPAGGRLPITPSATPSDMRMATTGGNNALSHPHCGLQQRMHGHDWMASLPLRMHSILCLVYCRGYPNLLWTSTLYKGLVFVPYPLSCPSQLQVYIIALPVRSSMLCDESSYLYG